MTTALRDATAEQIAALGAVTEMLVATERTIAAVQAMRDGLLALGTRIAIDTARSAGDRDGGDMATRAVAAEFGAALRVSDRTVERRMADADLLVTLFPRIWQAQGSGILTAAHTRAIVDAGLHLREAADRDAYALELIEVARTESPNRVARRARRVAERYQHRPLDERHREARQKRAIWVKDRADGMAELGLLGPAVLVHGAFQRVTGMAKAVLGESGGATSSSGTSHDADACTDTATDTPAGTDARSHTDSGTGTGTCTGSRPNTDTPTGTERDTASHTRTHSGTGLRTDAGNDSRTLAQTRCDLTLDLLLSGAPLGHDSPEGMLAAIRGSVSLTVPALTLMGASTVPAELDGRTPVDGDTASRLAGAASGWDRILTHPITGVALAVDRYRPTAEMRRYLRGRDQRCRFPTCGQPARDCDVDHSHDHALGGETATVNLATLCRRHHSLKHQTPWHVEQRDGGVVSWTSPTGRTYIDAPPPPHTITTRDPVVAPF